MINRLSDYRTYDQRSAKTAHAEQDRPRAPRPDGWNRSVENALGRYPLVTVLAGFAIGVILGWYIKR